MIKIPTLYLRDWDHPKKIVTPEINPECDWVFRGEGTATRKYDGTAMMFDGQSWWSRRVVKIGGQPPLGYMEVDEDKTTGTVYGWEPVEFSPFSKYVTEAFENLQVELCCEASDIDPGTYELIGPKVNGNPEGEWEGHRLINHDHAEEVWIFRGDFDIMREQILALRNNYGAEGVVWHHPDGRMAKLKWRDFG